MTSTISTCDACGKEFNVVDLYTRYSHKGSAYAKIVVCRECAAKLDSQKIEKPKAKRSSRKRKTTTDKVQ